MARRLLVGLGTIVVLALSAPGRVCAEPTSPAFAKALEKGEALMDGGKYPAAVKHLKKAEKLAGEPPVRLLLDLAMCHNNSGNPATAGPYARRALAASEEPSDRAGAYNQLGISLFQQVQGHFRLLQALDRNLSEPMTVSDEVKKPVNIRAAGPGYTDRVRKAGVEGVMVFEAIIDRNGDVRCVDVVQAQPMGMTEAGTRALEQWKFEPATLHGEPVVVKYNLTISIRTQ